MSPTRTTHLRHARTRNGLKQCELACKAGVGISSLCMWERGWKKPTLPTAEKLARVLHCAVQDLFPEGLKPY